MAALAVNAGAINERAKFKTATMRCDGKMLTVGTGKVKRTWRWTGKGWLTTGIENVESGKSWKPTNPSWAADWSIPTAVGNAELVSVSAREADDEGFTSRHLEVVSTVRYPAAGILLQHEIWAYPDAPGLRTQLHLKRFDGQTAVAGAQSPVIRVAKGRPFTPSAFRKTKPAPASFGSTVSHSKEIEIHIAGLNPSKMYSLGLSWWDWGGGGRWQSVIVSSIDGEAKKTVVPKTKLPGWENGRKQDPEQRVVAVPDGLYPGGALKVLIPINQGPNACISELWLYEHGATESLSDGVPADRAADLGAKAPKGAKLAAYMNCGAKSGKAAKRGAPDGIAESLPIALDGMQLQAIGYYSGTQQRNQRNTPLLKEEAITQSRGSNDWASILAAHSNGDGVVIVKESQKCVNTPNGGANTGGFTWGPEGIRSSGMGWSIADVGGDRYHGCWANWVILYHGNADDMALAMKIWDRARYPVDPKRDMYIMANTWGSTTVKRDAQIAAREDNVLAEIDSQADLGIDVQQIDDGWQGFGYGNWRPIKRNKLTPKDEAHRAYKSDSYPVYPNGWEKVREYAKAKGVRLGLWAAWTIPADDLNWNFDHGDFRYYKIDFAHLTDMAKVENLMGKARTLILHSKHKVRINWDVTERPARVGYFFGREYGNIYLENRKPMQPASVVYKPYLVLRDAWHVAKYINLNKFQVTVQNVDRVNRKVSDAWKHPHDYCVAQTLMGSPIFFQETHYYTKEARKQIRPLIEVYKKHRAEMFKGYVFPIGDQPDNRDWSGFQCHIPGNSVGYLTIFRQIESKQTSKSIALKFLKPGTKLALMDLMTGRTREVEVGSNGQITFNISKAPGFRFLRYKRI